MPELKTLIDSRNTVELDNLLDAGSKIADRFGIRSLRAEWPPEAGEQRALMNRLGGLAKNTLEVARVFKLKPAPDAAAIGPAYE